MQSRRSVGSHVSQESPRGAPRPPSTRQNRPLLSGIVRSNARRSTALLPTAFRRRRSDRRLSQAEPTVVKQSPSLHCRSVTPVIDRVANRENRPKHLSIQQTHRTASNDASSAHDAAVASCCLRNVDSCPKTRRDLSPGTPPTSRRSIALFGRGDSSLVSSERSLRRYRLWKLASSACKRACRWTR